MRFWICIPVYNRLPLTLRCLDTVHVQRHSNFRVVICDHSSIDGTSDVVRGRYPQVTVLVADSNLWWSGAINRCMEYALQHAEPEDRVLLLNNDTELPEDYLVQLEDACRRFPDDVITSVVADIQGGTTVSVGCRQNWLRATAEPVDPQRDALPGHPDLIEVTHASGRGTVYPLHVLRRIGLADELRLPHYGADYDLAMRARKAGCTIYVCLRAKVLSHIGETGLVKVHAQRGFKAFGEYFFGRRSPANLKVRFWLGWNNCPRHLLLFYLVADLVRVTGSYLRHHNPI